MNTEESAFQYCSDTMAEVKRCSGMFDLLGLSYDEVTKGDDGTEVRVVNIANYQIPIIDILGMNCAEFSKIWLYAECVNAYDTYVNNLVIVEGEDALTAVYNTLSREQEKIAMCDNIPEVFR